MNKISNTYFIVTKIHIHLYKEKHLQFSLIPVLIYYPSMWPSTTSRVLSDLHVSYSVFLFLVGNCYYVE